MDRRAHLDVVAVRLLRTDGLSLTLSATAMSPANAISCSSAWGERHPSEANSIWHIKVSSLSSLPFLFHEWFCSQASDAHFTGQSVCLYRSVCRGAVSTQFEIVCCLFDPFDVISKLCSNSVTYFGFFARRIRIGSDSQTLSTSHFLFLFVSSTRL